MTDKQSPLTPVDLAVQFVDEILSRIRLLKSMINVNITEDEKLIKGVIKDTHKLAKTRSEQQKLQHVLEKVTGIEAELLAVMQDLYQGEVDSFLDFVAMEKLLDDVKKSESASLINFNELIPDIKLDELVEDLQQLDTQEDSGEESTIH